MCVLLNALKCNRVLMTRAHQLVHEYTGNIDMLKRIFIYKVKNRRKQDVCLYELCGCVCWRMSWTLFLDTGSDVLSQVTPAEHTSTDAGVRICHSTFNNSNI